MADDKPLVPTSAVLTSIAKHIAVTCAEENAEFITCKRQDRNPATCLEQGKAVTQCVANLLTDLNSRCKAELKDYYECMDYYSCRFQKCRKEQKVFELACPPAHGSRQQSG